MIEKLLNNKLIVMIQTEGGNIYSFWKGLYNTLDDFTVAAKKCVSVFFLTSYAILLTFNARF